MPTALSRSLVVYVGGYQRVVGPRGARCKAGVGQNGSSFIEARVPGQGDKPWVSSGTIPACVGCVYDAACAYFPGASALNRRNIYTCPGREPGERVTRLSRTLVRVEVLGRISLMFFKPPPKYSYAGVSCYPAGTPLCTAVLADWRAYKRV